jgi:hypothetical protein
MVNPPVPPNDPIQQAGAIGDEEPRAQQVQAAEQENQMRALSLQDEMKFRELEPQYVTRDDSGKPTGFDWNGFQKAAMIAGVSPKTLALIGKAQADYRSSLLAMNAKQRESEEALSTHAYNSLKNMRGVSDPHRRRAIYSNALVSAANMGSDVSKWPQQAPDDNGLDVIETGLGMHAQALADSKTEAEANEAAAKGRESDVNAALGETNPAVEPAAAPASQTWASPVHSGTADRKEWWN